MKTNWQHQKDAITTDQKNRVDDENLREVDKRRVKATEKDTPGSPMKRDKPERKGKS